MKLPTLVELFTKELFPLAFCDISNFSQGFGLEDFYRDPTFFGFENSARHRRDRWI